MPDLSNYANLGATAIVAIFAFYFMWQNNKNKNGNGSKAVLEELKIMNNNHLEGLRRCIEQGNQELRDTLHDDNMKIIELLARIEGKVSK